MSKPPVLVFPGQGAQFVGMGKDLADNVPEVAAMFRQADEILGVSLSQIIFEGPKEALVDTANQQPALVLVSLAVVKALELKRGKPLEASAAAGLSLGEYSALASVGALSFEDAIKLVRRRGELMQQASQAAPSGMAVVLKLDEAGVRAACEKAAEETGEVISPCNFNGGGQIVIGGSEKGLERGMALCKEAGAKRAMKLPVAGAFHTALMQPAADGLKEALDQADFKAARAPVYANCNAQPGQAPEALRANLHQQLTSPVLWEQTVQNFVKAGYTSFLELGPGKAVSNMIRKIAPEAEVANVGTWEEVQAFE